VDRPSASSTPGSLRLEPSGRDTLSDRAYRAIRAAIINRELETGHYYSEAWLAGILGVSRTPTHSALLQLEIEGVVEIFAQRGFRLREIPDEEFDEFYEVRIILETNVLRTLCEKVDTGYVATLRELLDRQARAVADPALFLDLDEGFHRYMAEAAGLRRTAAIIHSLRGILWLGTTDRPDEQRASVVDDHRAIVEAVAAGDADAAVAALEHHLRRSAKARRAQAQAAQAQRTGTD
jgi:GntR family transcriptional regulator, rspAB operon transcriptional repressor